MQCKACTSLMADNVLQIIKLDLILSTEIFWKEQTHSERSSEINSPSFSTHLYVKIKNQAQIWIVMVLMSWSVISYLHSWIIISEPQNTTAAAGQDYSFLPKENKNQCASIPRGKSPQTFQLTCLHHQKPSINYCCRTFSKCTIPWNRCQNSGLNYTVDYKQFLTQTTFNFISF